MLNVKTLHLVCGRIDVAPLTSWILFFFSSDSFNHLAVAVFIYIQFKYHLRRRGKKRRKIPELDQDGRLSCIIIGCIDFCLNEWWLIILAQQWKGQQTNYSAFLISRPICSPRRGKNSLCDTKNAKFNWSLVGMNGL